MIDHGVWIVYRPSVLPREAPLGAMFAKRKSDDFDWYEYIRGDRFKRDSLKLTIAARVEDGPLVISAPTKDVTALFPAGHRVVELEGDYPFTQDELIKKYANKEFDLETGKISEPPAPAKTENVLDVILARLDKLERRK
jgi:hypothetical protein